MVNLNIRIEKLLGIWCFFFCCFFKPQNFIQIIIQLQLQFQVKINSVTRTLAFLLVPEFPPSSSCVSASSLGLAPQPSAINPTFCEQTPVEGLRNECAYQLVLMLFWATELCVVQLVLPEWAGLAVLPSCQILCPNFQDFD